MAKTVHNLRNISDQPTDGQTDRRTDTASVSATKNERERQGERLSQKEGVTVEIHRQRKRIEAERGKRREKDKERYTQSDIGRGRDPETNCRKSVRWLAVPVPCLSMFCLKLRGEQGSSPKWVDDLCFHTYGDFLLLLLLRDPTSPQPRGPHLSLKAHIPALRPKSQS